MSSKVEAKIAEIAKERNIPQEYAREISDGVLEIVEEERKRFEGETAELEGYIRCLEINFERIEKMHDAQRLRYDRLLKEKLELQNRVEALEGKKSELNLS